MKKATIKMEKHLPLLVAEFEFNEDHIVNLAEFAKRRGVPINTYGSFISKKHNESFEKAGHKGTRYIGEIDQESILAAIQDCRVKFLKQKRGYQEETSTVLDDHLLHRKIDALNRQNTQILHVLEVLCKDMGLKIETLKEEVLKKEA